MFLATTALSEFWDKEQEILFLGPWCLRYSEKARWQDLSYRVLPSQWDIPGKTPEALTRCDQAHEKLLLSLGAYLNKIHNTRHGQRYWRILLGPWLLGFISTFGDHEMHLRAAFEAYPGLTTWRLGAEDYSVAHDTAEHSGWLPTDRFNLEIYSQIIEHLGLPATVHSISADQKIVAGTLKKSWKPFAWKVISAVNASLRPEKYAHAYFSDLNTEHRRVFALVMKSLFRVYPLCRQLPEKFRFPPENGPRRANLSKLQTQNDFEGLLVSQLPRHLPTIFLEGYSSSRDFVVSDWRRLPKILITSVGWLFNEYFKLLAAESAEQGGKLVISQHGGAYGMDEPLRTERHERAIADQYWNWGWGRSEFSEGSAMLKPMPNPILTYAGGKPESSRDKQADCLLICASTTRYPYAFYFGAMPVWHRFEDYLEERKRFIAGLPPPAFSRLLVRLHASDVGWDQRVRLTARFPELRFDNVNDPWIDRLDRFSLVIIDHPQTSFLQALAFNIPTVLFWNPELWKMRSGVESDLDVLRQAGVLFDTPEDAARKVAQVIENPRSWWEDRKVQDARAKFCARYANSSKDWAGIWWRELRAIR